MRQREPPAGRSVALNAWGPATGAVAARTAVASGGLAGHAEGAAAPGGLRWGPGAAPCPVAVGGGGEGGGGAGGGRGGAPRPRRRPQGGPRPPRGGRGGGEGARVGRPRAPPRQSHRGSKGRPLA